MSRFVEIWNQSFALTDLPKVLVLSFLEILLSADNAVVLGILAHRLPEHQRTKALYIGTASAFIIRLFAILGIAYLIQYQWIQILGAVYLLYLAIHHFVKKRKKALPSTPSTFWKTVFLIEFFDLAFAIDSIVAAVAFISAGSTTSIHPKLWIAYVGGMIGLLGIRYAAHLFSNLIHRFPRLETYAYLLIGWIGIKLAYNAIPNAISLDPLFWTGMILLLIFGFFTPKKRHG